MDRDKLKIISETTILRILLLISKFIEFHYSGPRRKIKIIMNLFDDIKGLKEEVIIEEIKRLYKNKHIIKDPKTKRFILTERGKRLLEKYKMKDLKIKISREKFKGKWTLVFFDIPEDKRKIRDKFRKALKETGFYEIQRSVFIFPGVCKEEIEFLIDYFNVRIYSRYAICDEIDNQLHLKAKLGLL